MAPPVDPSITSTLATITQNPTILDPFDFGPSGFSWLITSDINNDADGGDPVRVADTNDWSGSGEATNATTVVNNAHHNAALAALNVSTDGGAVGVVGESFGGTGSVGVLGTSAFWGVAGIALSAPLLGTDDPMNNFPTGVGVFGNGDNVGLHGTGGNVGVRGVHDDDGIGVSGGSLSGIGVLGESGQGEMLPSNPGPAGTGVMGISTMRGGVFQTLPPQGIFPPPPNQNPPDQIKPFANIQLPPVPVPSDVLPTMVYPAAVPIPVLPQRGMVGDMLVVQVPPAKGVAPELLVQLWLCVKSVDLTMTFTGVEKVNAPAVWARIKLEILV